MKHIFRLFALVIILSSIFPRVSQASTLQYGDTYYFFGKNGFYVRLDQPINPNITSNVIGDVHFTLYWYDPKSTSLATNNPYNGSLVDSSNITITYTTKDGTFSPYRIDSSQYDIQNYDTQLKATQTGYKITLTIKSNNPKDKSIYNYYGASDTIDMEFNYFQSNTSGEQFITDLNNGQIKLFSNAFALNFPKDTYITRFDGSTPTSNQQLAIQVDDRPASTNEFIFLSHQYYIGDPLHGNTIQPSQPGKITLSYDQDIEQNTAFNNVSIAHYKNGEWIAIGSTVDNNQKKVTASIDDFGAYAVVTTYKTYKMDNIPNWALPYVMELSSNRVIQPDIFSGDQTLIDHINQPITRFEFISLMARAKGLQPIPNQGYFSDMPEFLYNTDLLGYDGSGYVMAAVVNGMVRGNVDRFGNNVIDPESPITREEAAVIIARASGLKIDTYDKLSQSKTKIQKKFKDGKDVSDWAVPYVQAVTDKKIINGINNRFYPKKNLTVAEACALVYNTMGTMKSTTNVMNTTSNTTSKYKAW